MERRFINSIQALELFTDSPELGRELGSKQGPEHQLEWEQEPEQGLVWEQEPEQDLEWEQEPEQDLEWEQEPEQDLEWEQEPEQDLVWEQEQDPEHLHQMKSHQTDRTAGVPIVGEAHHSLQGLGDDTPTLSQSGTLVRTECPNQSDTPPQ
ncbi:hypothetical protein chiPu_0022802, partial [Chiloscyllium punctatum]|nr:hypothetical protein [Chiloscyllium punctatum]